jgi:hypothetical protein
MREREESAARLGIDPGLADSIAALGLGTSPSDLPHWERQLPRGDLGCDELATPAGHCKYHTQAWQDLTVCLLESIVLQALSLTNHGVAPH